MPLEAQDAVYVALELALAALSVTGNVLVCAAVGTSTVLQTPTNYHFGVAGRGRRGRGAVRHPSPSLSA